MKRIDGVEFPTPDNLMSVREAKKDYITIVLPARTAEELTQIGYDLVFSAAVNLAEPKDHYLVSFRRRRAQ